MSKQIIFALSLCISISANAQVSVYGAAGINSTGAIVDDNENYVLDYKNESFFQPFFTAGLAAPISQKLFFLGEIGYSTNGYKRNKSELNQAKFIYKTINFQTGIGYQLGPIRLEGGGFFSKPFSGESEVSLEYLMTETFNPLKKESLGLYTGFNLSFIKNIGVFARYYRGLTPFKYEYLTSSFGGTPTIKPKEVPVFIQNLQFGISVNLF
jgi:hypothetical protein